MRFLIIRKLTGSELGLFGEYRRQGRETSRQRAINFDASVVEKVFPSALQTDEITLNLRFRGDSGVRTQSHPLRKQGRNWRLGGEKIDDKCFRVVDPGDLFLLTIDAIGVNPQCSFIIVKPDSELASIVLSSSETSALGRSKTGMIAIHSSKLGELEDRLANFDESLFGQNSTNSRHVVEQTSASVRNEINEEDLLQPPDARGMIQVVANFGYDLNVAVADLIDNSISAGAQNIEIVFPPPNENGRLLAISDDGRGMSPRELVKALRFAGGREYTEQDLGKYGIGLKSASLSQARAVYVSSKAQGGVTEILGWDKAEVEKTGEWKLSRPNLDKIRMNLLTTPLKERAGTVVLWDDMTPPKGNSASRRRPDVSAYGLELQNLSRHLGKVFHRFIEGKARGRPKLRLTLNGKVIAPWDPLLAWHADTVPLQTSSIQIPSAEGSTVQVEVHPAIIPASAEFTDEEAKKAAGFWGKWQDAQGFYFYRNDRIIQDGGWCDLWIKDPHYQLLRVAVDIDSKLDHSFGVNVAKMSVHPPAIFTTEIQTLLTQPRSEARKRYSPAGRKEKSRKSKTNLRSPNPPAYGGNTSNTGPHKEQPTPNNLTRPQLDKPIIGIKGVPLAGQGWRCRTDIAGNDLVELDTSLDSSNALLAATMSNSKAASALKKLLETIDSDSMREAVLKAWSSDN